MYLGVSQRSWLSIKRQLTLELFRSRVNLENILGSYRIYIYIYPSLYIKIGYITFLS